MLDFLRFTAEKSLDVNNSEKMNTYFNLLMTSQLDAAFIGASLKSALLEEVIEFSRRSNKKPDANA